MVRHTLGASRMIPAFFLSLLCFTLPAFLAVFRRKFREDYFFVFPVAVAVQICLFVLFSSLCRDLHYASFKLGLVLFLSSTTTLLVLTQLHFRRRQGVAATVWLAILAVFALVLVADQFYIVGKQGWAWDPGKPFAKGESYFRGPFNTDAERNTILTNALIRGKSSPFLPDGKLSYQLFWFYASSVILAGFKGVTRYSYVQGLGWALSYLFYFCLGWGLLVLRPTLRRKPLVFVALMLLAAMHADIVNGVWSFIKNGRLGMEADGSFDWVYFRNFSLKLTALLSPHHLLFLVSVLFFIVSKRISSAPMLRAFFAVIGFLTSPIFFGFFYSLWFAYYFFKVRDRKRFVLASLATSVVSVVLFHVAVGFPVWDLFLRQVSSAIQIFPWRGILRVGGMATWGLPLLWVNTLGVIGIAFTILVIRNWRRTGFLSAVLVVGNLGVYYIVTGVELQRHFVILSSFLVLLWLAQALPDIRRRSVAIGLGSLVGLSLGFHLFFVYAFTKPENLIEKHISYRDYFSMNQWMEQNTPAIPVVAGLTFRNGGFPIALESVTSFSVAFDAFIYDKINKERLDLLFRAQAQHLVLPYAKELGYKAVLWGPVEDRAWGPHVKRRFIDERALIHRIGQVGLYYLEDYFWRGDPPKLLASRAYRADKLFNERYYQESFDLYLESVRANPNDARALSQLNRIISLRN